MDVVVAEKRDGEGQSSRSRHESSLKKTSLEGLWRRGKNGREGGSISAGGQLTERRDTVRIMRCESRTSSTGSRKGLACKNAGRSEGGVRGRGNYGDDPGCGPKKGAERGGNHLSPQERPRHVTGRSASHAQYFKTKGVRRATGKGGRESTRRPKRNFGSATTTQRGRVYNLELEREARQKTLRRKKGVRTRGHRTGYATASKE